MFYGLLQKYMWGIPLLWSHSEKKPSREFSTSTKSRPVFVFNLGVFTVVPSLCWKTAPWKPTHKACPGANEPCVTHWLFSSSQISLTPCRDMRLGWPFCCTSVSIYSYLGQFWNTIMSFICFSKTSRVLHLSTQLKCMRLWVLVPYAPA